MYISTHLCTYLHTYLHIYISTQVLISTYKLATVLEVDIDPEVRNKRKAAALEAITSLLNTQEAGAEQKDDKKHHDKKHHDKDHHDKKRKKKKHK